VQPGVRNSIRLLPFRFATKCMIATPSTLPRHEPSASHGSPATHAGQATSGISNVMRALRRSLWISNDPYRDGMRGAEWV
jgi:hypothetical protein